MEREEMKNKGNASHKRPIVVNESVGSDDELSSEKKLKTNSRELVKNLLARVMNDSSHQKSVFFINFTRSIHDMGIEPINVLDCTLSWMLTERKSLKDEEAGFLLKVMNKVLPSCDEDKVRPLVSRIILVAQPFVEDASSHCCIKASEIIYTLSKITGLDEIAVLIRLQMNDSSDYVRDVAVKVMGIVASALGIHVVFPFIESCCRRIEPLRVRCAAIRMVEQFAVRIGCTLLPHLSPLIELMEFGLLHKDLEIMRITALSLAALAKAVAPYGYEHFKPILHRLFDFFSRDGVGFIHRRGKVLGALVKLFTCIIQLLTYPYPSDINWNVANGVLLVSRLSVDDEEMKEIGLEAIKSLAEIKDVLLQGFLMGGPRCFVRIMWTRTMMRRDKYVLLADATVALANKLGVAHLKRSISKELDDYSEDYRQMVLKIIEKLLACPDNSSDRYAQLEDAFQDIAYLFCSSF